MTIEEINEKSIHFMAAALIKAANEQGELNENEKENLLNVLFNSMTNVLKPEFSIIFNDYILSLSRKVEHAELFHSLNWN